MKYSEQERMRRMKSIDRSLKEISYYLRVLVELAAQDEPEVPKEKEEKVSTNAVGFEVTHDEDDSC